MTDVLIRRENKDRQKQREFHVMTETEIRTIHLQAKEHQRLTTTTKSQKEEKDSSLQVLEGTEPCQHLDFGLLASIIMRR